MKQGHGFGFSIHGPDYWYVGYENGTVDFFCDKRKLTEAEWRQEAPADQVAALDAELTQRSNVDDA